MDQFIGALAEPWARRWSGRVAGAALAFWTAGLVIYVARVPASAVTCTKASSSPHVWCQMEHAGQAGAVTALIAAAAVVLGSAYIMAALSLQLVSFLAGNGWPFRGPAVAVVRPIVRWLLRRQIDRRGRIAATGTRVPDQIPWVPEGPNRRRRARRALAGYVADMITDRAATAALRRYPAAPGAVGLTRVGSAMAAMRERVLSRHGLDLSVCWEPLLGVLPTEARDYLARESTRVALQGQNAAWAFAALAWTALFGLHWAALVWVMAVLMLIRVLYVGLCAAVETYCDLIESTVAVHRHRLYQAVGLALPASIAGEFAAGAALSAYLAGNQVADLPLSWPVALQPAEEPAGAAMPPPSRSVGVAVNNAAEL